MKLGKKGRCCGRTAIFYNVGTWRSPAVAPFYLCTQCNRMYGVDGAQRESWAWKKNAAGRYRRRNEDKRNQIINQDSGGRREK